MERRFKVMSRCPSCGVRAEYNLTIDESRLPFDDSTILHYKCLNCGHEYARKALETGWRGENDYYAECSRDECGGTSCREARKGGRRKTMQGERTKRA